MTRIDIPPLSFAEIAGFAAFMAACFSLQMLVLSTRFLTKVTYYLQRDQAAAERRGLEHRIVALEKEAALTKQPMETVNAALERIEESLKEQQEQLIEWQQHMDRRVTTIEARSSRPPTPG